MSDIGLDLAGIIAVFAVILTALVLILLAIITLAASFYQKSLNGEKLAGQNPFVYFLSATGLLIANSLIFVLVTTAVDHFSRDARETLDNLMLFGWLPLNLIAFWITGRALRRRFFNEK